MVFGSGVSREPYKSLGPFCSALLCSFVTNFNKDDCVHMPEPVMRTSTCFLLRLLLWDLPLLLHQKGLS